MIRTKSEVESWYLKHLPIGEIDKKLSDLEAPNDHLETLRIAIINHLERILLASPEELLFFTRFVDKKYLCGKASATTDFFQKILHSFNYSEYRRNVLVELAKLLNVKACPYCNLNYTLYATELSKRGEPVGLARFQFDHFFSKSDYPMLSMSLYNLIPSCPLCNQSKSKKKFPLHFHPYHSDVQATFRFEVKNAVKFFSGVRVGDEIDLDLVPLVPKRDFKLFESTYHLRAVYARHGDIVQEVFDKSYLEPYYDDPDFFPFLFEKSPDYLRRLLYGTYVDEKDIDKRPMSKFIQDIRNQALCYRKSK